MGTDFRYAKIIMTESNLNHQLIKRTVELVKTGSVVNSKQEKNLADQIFSVLSEVKYFKEHPLHLVKCPVHEDAFERYSILALIRRPQNTETILGIGHFDTVSIDDYGHLKPLATQPEILKQAISAMNLDPEILKDAADPDYLFGRGALDMKSGVAIWMTLLEQLSDVGLEKNLLVAFVCDEEGNSKGMIDALGMIRKMSEIYDLTVTAAIDTDYTSPQYPTDDRRFIYGGTIGKILVQFLCIGKETHAGDPYAGIDANHLVSALIEEINMNPAYCDSIDGNITVPPITLSIKDDKTEYSVQTAKFSSVSFNITTNGSPVAKWEEKMSDAARKAFRKVLDRLNQSYKAYGQMKGIETSNLPWQVNVSGFSQKDDASLKIGLGEDERDFACRWVKTQAMSDPTPRIILYLSMPYYPHHSLDLHNEKHRRFLEDIRRCAVTYTYVPNYPYISDLSFVRQPKPEDIADLQRLIPGYDQVSRINWSLLDSLDFPIINIGPWGKDAHKFTERVYVPSIVEVYQILNDYLQNEFSSNL